MERIYVLTLTKEDYTRRDNYEEPDSVVGYYATEAAAESALRAEISKLNNHSFEAWARDLGYEPWVTVDKRKNTTSVRFCAEIEYGLEGGPDILEDTEYMYTISSHEVIGS